MTSISRLSSPAPPKSRSPFPTAKPASPTTSSSASSSRHSSASYSRPAQSHSTTEPPPSSTSSRYDNPPSGSETEREPFNSTRGLHSYSSSDSLSATPTSSYSELRAPDFVRPRQISAPSSPSRTRNNRERDRDRASSPGPSSKTSRKRVSMAMSVDERRYNDESDHDAEDVTTAALAAVASSRRSPTNGNRRTRNPLPKEFREKDRRSMDGKVSICVLSLLPFCFAGGLMVYHSCLVRALDTPSQSRT